MPRPDSEIAVIGAGVVGLTTAIELLGKGAAVRIYARELDAPPASSVAPALFTPYPGPAPDRFRRWTEIAYARLRELAESAPDSGVHMGKLRELCYSPRRSDPWLDSLMSDVHLPKRAPFAVISDSVRPHMDTLRYLPWLRSRVLALGGSLIARDVKRPAELFELGHTRVVLCAGLGSAQLAHDSTLAPMHGQVVHVPNDIGLEYSLHDDAPNGLVAYIFRMSDRLVLGGTFDHGRTDPSTDDVSLEAVINRCRELLRLDNFPRWNELARRVLQARAAPRPARNAPGTYENIRLERESPAAGRALIHNYGHGRAGVTLAWATAADAADLALAR